MCAIVVISHRACSIRGTRKHTAQEQGARLAVRGYTLEQSQRIADAITSRRSQLRWVEQRVY
jgi:hypothetical protein